VSGSQEAFPTARRARISAVSAAQIGCDPCCKGRRWKQRRFLFEARCCARPSSAVWWLRRTRAALRRGNLLIFSRAPAAQPEWTDHALPGPLPISASVFIESCWFMTPRSAKRACCIEAFSDRIRPSHTAGRTGFKMTCCRSKWFNHERNWRAACQIRPQRLVKEPPCYCYRR
jgi:hypothetical protein